MKLLYPVLLILVLALFAAALARLRSTPREHPERQERADHASLLLLVFLGTAGAFARDRFAEGTKPYWLANAILVPVCLAVLWYFAKLFRSYRGEAAPQPRRSPTIIRPPKIDPPDGGGR